MACNPEFCCTPCTVPFAQVTMVVPPPILAPTVPQPVRPLQLYCPQDETPLLSQEERDKYRYDNFYNNYNMDWRGESSRHRNNGLQSDRGKEMGQTVDGQSPFCDTGTTCPSDDCDCCRGCPTGFKPCSMKLTPPPGCHPCGVWCAEIQSCPPKPTRNGQFQPGDCFKD